MDSIERTLTVLAHKIPDRIPVEMHNFLVTARIMGATNFADFFRDGEAMAEGQIQTWKRFGHDILCLENGTAALAQACGVEVIYQESSAPVATKPAISSLDEVEKLVVPDPNTDPILSELLKATRIVSKEIGDRAFIIGRGDQGPFSLACEIRGMDNFMMDLATCAEPEKIYRLLEYCLEVSLRYCTAQVESGAHMTSIGDSPSGPDLLSPRMYRQFAWPYVKRLAADLNAKGIRLSYHICGNATPIIADMVNSGAQVLEIDQKADQKTCKVAARGRAVLLGPVDPSGVLAQGTPAEVFEKCNEAISNLGPQEFILGPGCALPATTPDENMHAMV
ncbi:MAG: uroporphyrinogen decarboxylase family protein, partial [Anaerolineaceae bacterium]|nr:uroporphyrinogen decarboxylase family protein [Anaerolineaceae bacterium]